MDFKIQGDRQTLSGKKTWFQQEGESGDKLTSPLRGVSFKIIFNKKDILHWFLLNLYLFTRENYE
jgi:hypothetical protein